MQKMHAFFRPRHRRPRTMATKHASPKRKAKRPKAIPSLRPPRLRTCLVLGGMSCWTEVDGSKVRFITPIYWAFKFISRWNNPLIRSPLILSSWDIMGHPSVAKYSKWLLQWRKWGNTAVFICFFNHVDMAFCIWNLDMFMLLYW